MFGAIVGFALVFFLILTVLYTMKTVNESEGPTDIIK